LSLSVIINYQKTDKNAILEVEREPLIRRSTVESRSGDPLRLGCQLEDDLTVNDVQWRKEVLLLIHWTDVTVLSNSWLFYTTLKQSMRWDYWSYIQNRM